MTQDSENTGTGGDVDAATPADVETEVAQSPYRLAASPLLVGGPAPGGGLTGGPGVGTAWLALGGPALGDAPEVGDARTAAAVQAALEEEPMLDPETVRGIEVIVHGTTVALLGRVPASADSDIAERVASRLPAVSAVENRLQVGDSA